MEKSTSDDSETCAYEGCEDGVYAKGYCRKHYNMLWRTGKVGKKERVIPGMSIHESDTLKSLQRELEKAKDNYANSYGLQNRVRWRREINEIEDKMAKDKVAFEEKIVRPVIVEADKEELSEFLENE